METPIKPGKYKMRNGKQAIIAAVAPDEIKQAQPLTGWLQYADNKWCGGSWAANGAFHLAFSNPSEFDLISPWIDAPVFNHWDKVPWAKCVYKRNDAWWASSELVEWFDKDSSWDYTTTIVDKYVIKCSLYSSDCPTFTGPDKDSLILRPANV